MKIDDVLIGNGRTFMVSGDQAINKTLTIEKGPDADKYENIHIFR